ncbi:putative reverse transcriptase domain-containing protein [Tanacetum coccineum]|uniref:Reverse transcriptase domain-containing protein n=1 Tax=Tanacetum coccineum TaxID=301880 RepID=A0ABQ4WRL8_9ASTR
MTSRPRIRIPSRSRLKIIEASTIAISFDSSDESVGSPPSWVILFGDIPTVIPSNSVVAPETSTIVSLIYFISALVLRRLFTFPATIYTPFLCTDSSKAPDSSDGPPSQDPYVMVIARWRSKVASRLSSSYEFPIAPITAMPEIHRRLAWRHALPCSSNHRPSSSSSSSDSFPVYSSGLATPDQAHFGSLTRDVPPRLCYPPRRDTMTEEPLHSFSHSAGPSRKRYRSLINFIPSSTPVMGSLASTRADLLPPCKRFRDSYSSEASIEEDTKDDTEEYKTDTSAGDTVEVGIDPMSAPIVEEEIVEPVGEDSSNLSGTRDGIVRIVEIETVQRRLEADQLITRGERAGMIERIKSLRLENLKVRAMLDIKRDRMNCLRLHMSLSQEAFCQVRRDRDDTRGRLRRLESILTRNGNDNGGGDANGNDTRNGNNGGDNGDGNENRNGNKRGDRPGARKCTYQDFIKCQPLSFKGTEGVVKYATCTLLDSALTWWNSHKRTIETDAAYALSWRELLKLMTEVYCLRNEIQKMETELWNLSVKNNDMVTYTQRFQELTMMSTKMVPKEEDRVEKFIGGLTDNIQGNMIGKEPTRLQDVVRIANHLMDKKLKGYVNTGGQNVARAYTTSNNEKKGYEGTLPFCIRVPNARGKAYVLGGGDANPGSNTVTDIILSALDVSYAVELANGRTLETSTVLRAKNHVVIVYDEKIVRIPYGNEILIIQGDKSDKEKKSTLSIISCVKARKYMEKGCQLFLAQVTVKENKDKSKEKRLEDVPTVRDFPKVFLEDLPGLPPIRQVEF